MTRPRGHTGTTSHGNTRDVRVERLGYVTIYKRAAQIRRLLDL
jgi:hypothetical protein